MTIKKNLVANYLGVAWSSVMSIIFLPFYLHYIGAEGYGLIGFFTMLSVSLSSLDAGLGAVAAREASGYIGANDQRKHEIGTLLHSIEILMYGISLIIGLSVAFCAPLIVRYWLNVPENLMSSATWAVGWMGLTIAMQFPTSFYCGCLNGFQKQVGLNATNIVGSTLRGGGAVLILWLISPTVESYFAWQVLGALGMLIAFRVLFVKNLEVKRVKLRFSLQSLIRVRHFLGGMGAINITALLLTQLDKIILSSALPLASFGYYSLAWMLGNTLTARLTGPVFTAYYPKITQLKELINTELMLKSYRQGCKLMSIVVVPISLWLALFSHDILLLWSQNKTLADEASGALVVIAIGTMLNAFMHIPYAMQLAHSFTRLALVQNVVSVILIAPMTWYLATHYNLTVAALPWIIVNAGGVFIAAPLMHRYLGLGGLKDWYVHSLLLPILYAGCSILVIKVLWMMLIGHKFFILLLPISLAVSLLLAIYTSKLVGYMELNEWKAKLRF